MNAKDIIEGMLALGDERQRKVLMRFFKTGPGEYGEGDDFLSRHAATMPRTALRYAIELLPENERQYWMRYKVIN